MTDENREQESIALEATAEGAILPVQAQAGARRNGIVGAHAGRVKVAVTQAPEKGKANAAIIEVLAGLLKVKRSRIVLLGGATSSQKKFLVEGLGVEELAERLAALL
jgi:uncharacterized protein (TIGR00251 family)